MKKFLRLLCIFGFICSLTACGDSENLPSAPADAEISSAENESESITENAGNHADTENQKNEMDISVDIGVFDLENGTVLLNSGYTMPILGIGTFTLSNEEAENFVYWALKDGFRLIDTARIYGNDVICCKL